MIFTGCRRLGTAPRSGSLHGSSGIDGGACSLADIALCGYTHCADEGGFELSRYRAVGAWLKRVAAQPRLRLDQSW
jgi:glutathione S-transferase